MAVRVTPRQADGATVMGCEVTPRQADIVLILHSDATADIYICSSTSKK